MGTPSANQYFEAIHTGPGDPTSPNLFTAAELVAGSFSSAAVSSATSTAVSTVNAAAPDSSSISQAKSQAVSAASNASIADSKAVSVSSNTSVADSKALSNSLNISIADSKAVSVAVATPTVTAVVYSGNISVADSKAVSLAIGVPAASRVNSNLSTYVRNNAVFNVLDYSLTTINDGVGDATAAINLAWADVLANGGGRLHFPYGKYKTTSNLVFSVTGSTPKHCEITFDFGAVLLPALLTVAVTLATDPNSDGNDNYLSVRGMRLDGVSTTGATGILVGENAGNLSGNIQLQDVTILRFAGVGGKGLYIKNSVACEYQRVYVGRCYVNIYVNGSDPALPTVQRFIDCHSREATTKGIQIERAYRLVWDGGVFESNSEEGIYCVPSASANVLYCVFRGVWFEANYSAGNFHATADGTNAGTLMLKLADCNFSGVAKSVSFQKVRNFTLDNIYPTDLAGSVTIDAGVANQSSGDIVNWPENNVAIATRLTNNSNLVGVWGPYSRGKIGMDSSGNLSVLSGTPTVGAVTNRFGKAFFTSVASYYAQPTYGVTVTIDAATGNFQQVLVTDAVAFTMANPTNPALSMFLTVQIRNTSGGAMGAITWGAAFKLAGAFTNPATGQNRQITFVYDSGNTKWYEVSRTTADSAN